MRRSILIAAVAATVLVAAAAVTQLAEAAPGGAKKAGGGGKPPGKQYHEVVDLFLDMARGFCTKLGPLVDRGPKYVWTRRCDIMYEAIELFLQGFSETMVDQIGISQQQMVNTAVEPMRLFEARMALKGLTVRALESESTDEKKLQLLLNHKLSQWIMNCAIGKDSPPRHESDEDVPTPYTVLPPFDVEQSDVEWAETVSADDYVDDLTKDDPMAARERSRKKGNPDLASVPDSVRKDLDL